MGANLLFGVLLCFFVEIEARFQPRGNTGIGFGNRPALPDCGCECCIDGECADTEDCDTSLKLGGIIGICLGAVCCCVLMLVMLILVKKNFTSVNSQLQITTTADSTDNTHTPNPTPHYAPPHSAALHKPPMHMPPPYTP
eukprot:NODE_6116_length_571_cov_16.542793_g5951_i0.p1 GENE.NODE_6116_length_571_cov_16.542793_g5951_i0~~NODE_6116_length_571_cov_16.542793_g5951_i0.p1  ORF type:complete len:153 (+),score=46.62 NODE_6116_length_571_cov_16.542793_g5951_i0:40-459(+)